jgi:hypothetical protein
VASTSITVENRSDIPITAKLTWGFSDVGSVGIPANNWEQKGPSPTNSIPCEYVWYDLRISNNNNGIEVLMQKAIKGGTSWFFDGNATDGYHLWERPKETPPILQQEPL